ncbi:hypothetical protein ACFX13_007080 [Malus domestica]
MNCSLKEKLTSYFVPGLVTNSPVSPTLRIFHKLEAYCKRSMKLITLILRFLTNNNEITDSFARLLVDLERSVEQMLFERFGAGKQYESVAGCNSHLLRFLKHNKPEEITDSTLRFASHKDKNFTTLVVRNDVGGLEVDTKEGDWINIECPPSQFLFMAGSLEKDT